MQVGAYVPCQHCGKRTRATFYAEAGKEAEAKFRCEHCGKRNVGRLWFEDGYPRLDLGGKTYNVGFIPQFAKADFVCQSCGKPRKVYVTPPHPTLVPYRMYGRCPDCGVEYTYDMDYEGPGKRLRVVINGSIEVFPQ